MSFLGNAGEERVLVLAPTRADAVLTQTLLTEAGLSCHILPDLESLCAEIVRGAAVVLLTEEVLAEDDPTCVVETLAAQPHWSDIPILLLTSSGAESSVAVRALELFGNVTLLERPVRLTTLISGLRAALRARRRQYELRRQLERLQKQSERLRLLWETAAVLLTTEEPHAMLRGLFAKIAPHFGLDTCLNFMSNPAGDALHLESYIGIPPEDAANIAKLELGQFISGAVAQSRQPITAAHIQQSHSPELSPARSFGLRAYACNPLMAADRLLGTLAFASRTKDSFEEDELEFLQTVCHYVAYAYERLRLIRQLREEDEKKNEFLATLAHELRNPLAPIRNAAAYFRLKGPVDIDLQYARDIIERQVEQMTRLVDDLLDISRITRGKIVLQNEAFDVGLAVANAVESSRPLIDDAAHELVVQLPTEPLVICGDSFRLSQVFGNLLTNAAKYTDRNGRIVLRVEADEKDAVVSVRDSGIGIHPDYLPRIFDMFSQVDPALERSQGGLGIGLALVRSLVEMHGGRVEARSAGLQQGSEFLVRLPLAEAASSAQLNLSGGSDSNPHDVAPAIPSQSEAFLPVELCGTKTPLDRPLIQHRIIVADDNEDAARTLTMLLSLQGHDVRTAFDGQDALEVAEAFRPDIMLIDIGMPKLNGYEAARAIRGRSWGSNLLLVALTGWGQEEDKRRAKEAGFDHHFTKPVDLAQLESLLG